MSAEAIARALGGRKLGGSWTAQCPAHHDRLPNLSLRDAGGRVLVHCHAGCSQESVIAALRERGLWFEDDRLGRTAPRGGSERTPDTDNSERTETALAIWRDSTLAMGTPVETYFISRGINLPPPPMLRFHPGLRHPSGGIWPAMVALVANGVDGTPVAIHRTFIAPDGRGKAPISPQKTLSGPCRGGAARLGNPVGKLIIGEGIETCLFAMQSTGYAAWAALSTSGL